MAGQPWSLPDGNAIGSEGLGQVLWMTDPRWVTEGAWGGVLSCSSWSPVLFPHQVPVACQRPHSGSDSFGPGPVRWHPSLAVICVRGRDEGVLSCFFSSPDAPSLPLFPTWCSCLLGCCLSLFLYFIPPLISSYSYPFPPSPLPLASYLIFANTPSCVFPLQRRLSSPRRLQS